MSAGRTGCLVGKERALELLDEALSSSQADETEIFLAARTSSVLRFAGERVHQAQDLASLQVMVRAVVDGRAARVATSSPGLCRDAVARACQAATELGASTPERRAEPHAPAAPGDNDARRARSGAAGALWYEATEAYSASERAADIAELMALARARSSTGRAGKAELAGALAAGTTELAVVSSRGIRRYGAATEASLSCTAQVGPAHDGAPAVVGAPVAPHGGYDDGSGREAAVGSGTSHAEELTRDASSLDVVAVGESLLDEASAMRGATELAPGRYDVVFGPQAAAELVAFLPAFGFTAAALAAGVGVVAAGDRRFSALVTVVDDATGGPGLPFPFDCEGVSKQRVELIASGVPHGVVSDLASATVTGGSTGHAHIAREEAPAARAANLRLEAGSFGHGIDGLVAGVEQGVYIQRLWYTRVVDSARGVITGTTRDAAFLIRDGKLDRPVSGMRFTESVLDALERVDALGSDVHCLAIPNVWNGCVGAPAMRVRGFRLGVAARTASSR